MKAFIQVLAVFILAPLAASSALASELTWQDYELRGYMDTQSRQMAAVELALTNGLERLNASGKASDAMVLSLLEKLITVSASQGKYAAALDYSNVAIRFAERIANNERTAILYASQGDLQRQVGKLTEAELSYDRALKLLPVEHSQRPATLHGLARVKCAENQLLAADAFFKQALESQTSLKLQPSPAELTRYAECCEKMGATDKAIGLIKEALRVDEEELGKNHPVLSSELNNLAMMQANKGELAESEKNMRRAVALCRLYHYRDINDWLHNLAVILQQAHKDEEADALKSEIKKTTKTVGKLFTTPSLH